MRSSSWISLCGLSLVIACSSTPSANDGGADATTNDAANDAALDVAQDVANDVTPSDAGVEAACPAPSTLHPPSLDGGATIFCPFSGADGGKDIYCTSSTQHCCEPPAGTATCDPIASACASNETDWQCQDPVADCPVGQKCCASANAALVISDAGCANFATGFKGASCAVTCPGLVLCTSDGECPNGQTCVPFETKGAQVGACQ